MILIALGANIPGPAGGPKETLERALTLLEERGARVVKRSHWYKSSPVPPSGQPDYINAVVQVETELEAPDLLKLLHKIEAELGRTRRQRWEARPVDLDLLVYDHICICEGTQGKGAGLILPHPRMHLRRFVLMPLAEIAPADQELPAAEGHRWRVLDAPGGADVDWRAGRLAPGVEQEAQDVALAASAVVAVLVDEQVLPRAESDGRAATVA